MMLKLDSNKLRTLNTHINQVQYLDRCIGDAQDFSPFHFSDFLVNILDLCESVRDTFTARSNKRMVVDGQQFTELINCCEELHNLVSQIEFFNVREWKYMSNRLSEMLDYYYLLFYGVVKRMETIK